jgi:hypothetical protein
MTDHRHVEAHYRPATERTLNGGATRRLFKQIDDWW